jgi:segregation and condensation protein A
MEEKRSDQISQNQFYDLITGEEVSWQAIIYDLIKTEQLDPWDIDLGILAEKYSQVVREMEDANFFVSSKVLLACSLLLRLKSEILINEYIRDLDDALYGRKNDKRYELERIELDEDELPILVPRTPMPRYKKVTLEELMKSLNQAMETENRRIKRDIRVRQANKSALVVMPNKNRIPLKNRIALVLKRIKDHMRNPSNDHMKFSHLASSREERLLSFVPVLHLSNNDQIYLYQYEHFGEIHMHLKKIPETIEGLVEESEQISNEEFEKFAEQEEEEPEMLKAEEIITEEIMEEGLE